MKSEEKTVSLHESYTRLHACNSTAHAPSCM